MCVSASRPPHARLPGRRWFSLKTPTCAISPWAGASHALAPSSAPSQHPTHPVQPCGHPHPRPTPYRSLAQLLARLLPRSSPQGHYPTSSSSLLFLSLALKERVVGAIAGAPSRPDWLHQALACHTPLYWPAAMQRKRGRLWGHLVPDMELGQAHLSWDYLRWQGTCPGGSHLAPGLL